MDFALERFLYTMGVLECVPEDLLPKEESAPMTSLQPQAFESPDDVLRRIVRSCQPYGQSEDVTLFCRTDRPEQLLCTVSMSGNVVARCELTSSREFCSI